MNDDRAGTWPARENGKAAPSFAVLGQQQLFPLISRNFSGLRSAGRMPFPRGLILEPELTVTGERPAVVVTPRGEAQVISSQALDDLTRPYRRLESIAMAGAGALDEEKS
jgi:hypothetical protein